ncbi:MAG: histidine phosphatase family protein [Candidatus Hodarchaeales archaeon]|jgi:probable phosphoglycerate mutase
MIYIVRHGETAWNKEMRKQGRSDSPLTLRGFSQACAISDLLRIKIEDFSDFKIIHSPLFRTKQFASLICECIGFNFSDCESDDLLMEHCFGLWEGKTEQEIEAEFPNMIKERESEWWDFIVPMGESYELIHKRAKKFLEKVDEDENLILITHEMISKVLRGIYGDLSKNETLSLGHHQDTIYQMSDNKIVEIKTL